MNQENIQNVKRKKLVLWRTNYPII